MIRSWWKCDPVFLRWKIAAMGRAIYMVCLPKDAEGLPEWCGVSWKEYYKAEHFSARVFFVPQNRAAEFELWAEEISAEYAETYPGYRDYCEGVWRAS